MNIIESGIISGSITGFLVNFITYKSSSINILTKEIIIGFLLGSIIGYAYAFSNIIMLSIIGGIWQNINNYSEIPEFELKRISKKISKSIFLLSFLFLCLYFILGWIKSFIILFIINVIYLFFVIAKNEHS